MAGDQYDEAIDIVARHFAKKLIEVNIDKEWGPWDEISEDNWRAIVGVIHELADSLVRDLTVYALDNAVAHLEDYKNGQYHIDLESRAEHEEP